MDEADRRIMEMKIEEAIAWHDGKMTEIICEYGKVEIGTPGHQLLEARNGELYRMVKVATGIDD